jgi:hypothetical protein
MKKLVLVALAVGGLAITGCSTEEGGYFDVSWGLTDSTGAAATCGEAVTAKVTATGASSGTFVDLFDCSAGGGTTALLPLDDYIVTVELLDVNNGVVADTLSDFAGLNESFASHGPATAADDGAFLDLDGEVVLLDFDLAIDGGYFGLSWAIEDGGVASDCTSVGSGGVEIASTFSGTTDAVTDIFNCTDANNISDVLPIGQYEVSISLLDQSTPPLALDVIDSTTENITYGNELVDLGIVVLDPN